MQSTFMKGLKEERYKWSHGESSIAYFYDSLLSWNSFNQADINEPVAFCFAAIIFMLTYNWNLVGIFFFEFLTSLSDWKFTSVFCVEDFSFQLILFLKNNLSFYIKCYNGFGHTNSDRKYFV